MLVAPLILLAAPVAAAALDEAEQQCPFLSPRLEIGPETVVRRIGSLPSFDWFDPREMKQRGPNGEVIVPLIGLQDRVEWTDGISLSVEDPFVRTRDPPRPTGDAGGVEVESGATPTRPTRARLVVNGVAGPWHDEIVGWRRSVVGATPHLAYGARDGDVWRMVLDGDVVDRVRRPGERAGAAEFGFSSDGASLYWTFDDRVTKVRNAAGGVTAYPCEPVRRRALVVGERGIALDCLFSQFALVIVMNDGRAFSKPLPGGEWLEAWWISADGAHFITSTDRWVVIDGVRGPEAAAIWALEIDEPRRRVRYLALFESAVPRAGLDVVEVETRWPPDGTCGEPFVEWRHGS